MRKLLPLIMVLAFWSIFLWGMNNPKVGDAVIAITIVGITIIVICLIKNTLKKRIANSK